MLSWFFQWAFHTAGATIVSGAVAERVKNLTYAAFAFLMTSFVLSAWHGFHRASNPEALEHPSLSNPWPGIVHFPEVENLDHGWRFKRQRLQHCDKPVRLESLHFWPLRFFDAAPGVQQSRCRIFRHERIMAQSRNLSVRADAAAAREEELEQRLEGLDAELKRLQAAEEELQWSQEDVEAACLEAREALEDARQREKVLIGAEDDLARTAEELSELELKVVEKESALAQDESDLIEARNMVEKEISRVQDQHDSVEQEALSLQSEFDYLGHLLDEVEREQWALESDKSLLAEIESQVEPIRKRLVDRERRVRSEEEELNALEAEYEREAQSPEYEESMKGSCLVQRRQQELESQIEETRQEQQRLLQQLQDISDGTGLQDLNADVASEEEMRSKLMQFRNSESDWAESVRLHQVEVQKLEVKLKEMKVAKTKMART